MGPVLREATTLESAREQDLGETSSRATGLHRSILAALSLCLLSACALEPPGNATLGLFGNEDPRVFYGRELGEKVIALTIDDTPDPDSTPRILEVLRENGAHATFFVIGEQVPGHEQLIDQIVSEGHELGNHMSRDEKSIDLDDDAFERDLVLTQSSLSRFGPVVWFRPGSGYYDDTMLDTVERHGLRCALGTVYPLDAQIRWGWLVRSWIARGTRPGAVVILHDRGERGMRTARTLERVLPRLREKGYRVVTLSQLAAWPSPSPPSS